MRNSVIALATVAGLVAAAGCGSGGSGGATTSNGKVVVTFANWAAAETNTAPGIAAMIREFESLHHNITIKSEPISYTDIEHQLVLEEQSGNAPDVAEVQGNYLYTADATSGLQPLASFASSQFQQSIIPRELALSKIGGQLVAIPWTVGPLALWYNKKIMSEAGLKPQPPATWAQLLADAKVIHAKLPKVIVFGDDSTSREYGLDENWPIMKSFGAVPFSGSTATSDTPAMQNYLAFMRTLDSGGYTPEGQKAGYFRQPAASNQVAFTNDGPYVKGVVQSVNHESDAQFYANWGVTPLPAGTSGVHYSVPTDHQLVMFKTATGATATAAWQFMTFLATSSYAVTKYTIPYEGSIPPLAHPAGPVASLLDNPVSQEFLTDVIPDVITPSWGTQYSSSYLDVMAGIQKAMTTSAPISQVAASMQSAVSSDVRG
jgi:ABC-type glycerol-3-phosphate transport system substrate-binding protein